MNEELRKIKQIIRAWIRAQYTDERLVGAVTAKHSLVAENKHRSLDMSPLGHYAEAMKLPNAQDTENAFMWLGHDTESRRMLIIPILKAEIRRRDRLAQASKLNKSEISEVNKGELVI